MKWMRLKIYLLPLIMQEVDSVTELFINLINDIRETGNPDSNTHFLEIRAEITKRIEELEQFFEENIRDTRIAYIEKARIKLKKLLMYDPDILNKMQNTDNLVYDRDFEDNKQNQSNVLYYNHKKETSNIYNERNPSPNHQPKMIGKVPSKASNNQRPVIKNISNVVNNIQKNEVKPSNKNISLNRETVSRQTLNTVDSKISNIQNLKQPLSDRKHFDISKKPVNQVPSSHSKLSSLSPKRASDIHNKSLLTQPHPDDLISWLASDNSFVISRYQNSWKEIAFKIVLNENDYKKLIREKANKVTLK